MRKIFGFFCAIAATIPLSAEVLYRAASAPIDTVDVVCYDLEFNTDFIDIFSMAYIFANNSDYELTGAIFADSVPPGTYTDCVMDLKHKATQTKIPAKENGVSLTLSVDANRHCAIVGTMIGEDNILYNLDLSWTVPTPTDTVHIAFDTSASVAYYPDFNHDFALSNRDDNYDITLDILAVPMGETFTESNLFVAYCLIANRQTQDTIKIAAADGQVWQSNDTTYLYAKVIGFDAVMYDIQLWYAVPEVTQMVNINIQNATFHNEMESDGYFALVGTTEDKNTEFAISILADTEEDIPGTYINDGLFGGFSGQNYDFVNFIGGQYTTYIAHWNPESNDYDIVSIEKGETKITMDEQQDITLVGSFIGRDGIKYQVTMTSKVDKPRFEMDATEGAIDRTFVGQEGVTIDTTKVASDGIIHFEIFGESELLALWFITEQADDEIIIPEGTYYIDHSDDYQSVVAADGSLTKSFYATHDGVEFTSFYFFASGIVTVTNNDGNLYMEINAFNSYDVPVHIIYDGTGTAVENIPMPDDDCQKRIVNGQLLIQRGDMTFNAIGLPIK